MTQRPKNFADRRSSEDRGSSNRPELTRLVDRVEAMKNTLSEKERAVLKTEEKDADQDVKLKFEFECSEGLARDLLGGIVYLLQGKNNQKQIRDRSEALHYLDESTLVAEQYEEGSRAKHSPESRNVTEQDTALVCHARPKKLTFTILIILLTVATLMGGFEYLDYQKRKARELAETRRVQKNQQLYEQYLASSLDILLKKLDQMTATPKMSQVFPEISSMSAIVRFKRGPAAADKARAAREFIYRVKEIFDNWVERANDFLPEERPGKKEITYFLSVWHDTETILNQLEAAKSDPSQTIKTIIQ